MFKQQITKALGGTALAVLLLSGAGNVWAQNTAASTPLPAPPSVVMNAPDAPPPPEGPLGGPGGPGGPREPGPRPGGPEAMANTQAGAVREITHAYQAIADATGAISTTTDIDALAGQMVTHSKTLYGQAYTSYNTKNWFAANETAKAAVAAADVVNHLAQSMNSAPLTVPDLQAPPVITDSMNLTGTVPPMNEPQKRAGDELTHGYNAIIMAKVTAAANPKLTDADFYLTNSETLYKSAYAAYTAKDYNKAAELAHAAHSAADVIIHLNNAANGIATPGAPTAPPAPNF